MRNYQKFIATFLLIVIQIFRQAQSKSILFARDWLVNPQDLAGWSNNTTELCDGQIMDANKLVFMLNKDIPNVFKTFENLPRHWSIGIRLDFIIVDNWNGASMKVLFDDQILGNYVSSNKGKKLLICGYPKEEDKYERGYYNITHEEDKFVLKIEHTITNYAKLALLDLEIHLELCDDSCLKCKGPTKQDCTECQSGLILQNGQCICQQGYMFEGTCILDCPQFYRNDENLKVCQIDLCQANCKTCDDIHHKCVQCVDGFNLLYGSCVETCPSYSNTVNGICIDEMHNYWNSTYLVKAFFGNDFSQSEIVGHNFQSNFYDDENIIPKENWAQVSDCNNYRLYGGFGLYGRKTFIKNEWVIPWYHSSVRIKFFYAQIENYEKDPETGEDEKLSIYLNGVEKWFMTKGQDNKNACGRLDQGEHFGWLEANMTNLHKGDKLTFEVLNNFYDPAWFEGFGLREFTVIVDRCTSNCISCKDDVGCVQCEQNYFMHKAYCLNKCPSGFYGDISTMTCKPCHKSCLECEDKDDNKCTKCFPDRYLHSGMCLEKCPAESFSNNQNNQCDSCIVGCISCTDATKDTCQGCKDGFYELNQECFNTCPDNYYADQNDFKCKKCNQLCNTCTGPSEKECKSCYQNSNTYLFNSECNTNCPQEGYYPNKEQAICSECFESCKSCSNKNFDSCYKCKEGYYYQQGQCVKQCFEGYFNDNSQMECKNCSEGCKLCSEAQQDKCISCFEGYYFFEGKCLKTCNDNYFEQSGQNPTCEKCNITCLKCIGKEINQCIKCQEGSYLHENQCIQQCPESYFENKQNNECQKCTNNCKKCTSSQEDSCIQCKENSYLHKGLCLNVCPDETFGDFKINECIDCPGGCRVCRPDQCIECHGKNRLGPADNCKCISGYSDKVGKSKRQILNCIKESSNPNPQIEIENKQTQKQQSDQKIYGILKFDKEVQISDYKNWRIEIPNSNQNAYFIELTPFEQKKMYSEIQEAEIESNQKFYITILIKDSSKINSNVIRIEFIDIYSVQDSNESPLSVNYIEERIPIILNPLNETDEDVFKNDTSNFNLGMNCVMSLIAVLMVFLLPLYQTANIFDLLQIINYLNYLNVNYPGYLIKFFKAFDIYNLHILPSIKNEDSVAPQKFRADSIDTFLFSNIIQAGLIWIVFYVLYLISKLGNHQRVQGKLKEILLAYNKNYKYKIIFTIAFITYCNMLTYTFLQLQDSSFDSFKTCFGPLVSLVFLAYFLSIYYFSYESTHIQQKTVLSDNRMRELFSFFFEGIFQIQGKNLIYLIILIRKTLLIGVLVFSQQDHIKQILLWALIIGAESLCFLLINPFQMRAENQIHLFCRLMLVLTLVCIASLGIDDINEGFSDEGRMFCAAMVIIFCSAVFCALLITFIIKNCKVKLTKIFRKSNNTKSQIPN